ncbi:hypothetical protein D3C80_1774050 [compost metagenome]
MVIRRTEEQLGMLLTLEIVQQMMAGNHGELVLQAAAAFQLHLQLLQEIFAIPACNSQKQLFLAFKI